MKMLVRRGVFIAFLFFPGILPAQDKGLDAVSQALKENPMPRYVIRTMIVPHCKRGPQVCDDCRTANVEKVYVLDIDPPLQGEVQRPIVDLRIDGAMRSFEYDVRRGFDTEEKALNYAREEGIDVLLIRE